MGTGDGRLHDIAAFRGGGLESLQGGPGGTVVAAFPPGRKAGNLFFLGRFIDTEETAVTGGQWALFGLTIGIDADHGLFAGLDGGKAAGIGFDEGALHIAGFDGGDGAAQVVDASQFFAGLEFQLFDLFRNNPGTVENIVELQEIGFIGDDLLQAQRPLLVPGARQAQGLVPGRQLHGPRPGVFAQHDGQHFQQNPIDVVFRLLFGEAQRVHLNAISEPSVFFLFDAKAVARNLLPQFRKGPHLGDFRDQLDAGVEEKTDAPDDPREISVRDLAPILDGVQHGNRRRHGKSQFLHRFRPGFLQVVGADIDRVPFRHFADREGDHVGGQFEARTRREDMGAAGQVFLDDIVLGGAAESAPRHPGFFSRRDIKRQQPGCRGIDGHRGIHLVQGNIPKQGLHVTQMADWHADLADFAQGQGMVRIVAGLGRQVESHRKAGLSAPQIGAEEGVRFGRRSMPGIGPEKPRTVTLHCRSSCCICEFLFFIHPPRPLEVAYKALSYIGILPI